jgi:16S rRNA (cytosine967-C5)-methyltransferase
MQILKDESSKNVLKNMKNMPKVTNPRMAAFLALLHFHKGGFIEDYFQEEEIELSKKDFNLAQEIAYTTVRRLFTLEFIAKKITKIDLKRREKLLLFCGLCQYFFMDKIPLFAICDETTFLAKKYFGAKKAAFFNFFFRKLSELVKTTPELSLKLFFDEIDQKNNEIENLSILYSYPSFFINELLKSYSIEKTKQILEVMNEKSHLCVRARSGFSKGSLTTIHENIYKVYQIDPIDIISFSNNKNCYIQNQTPVLLIEELTKYISPPEKILDLCSAPGGKLIALHDLFLDAKLFANDKSVEKIDLLKSNLKKYAIDASIHMQDAKEFKSDEKFDLIVLDVPCSNSGVLNKRAEARYRLDEESVKKLCEDQFLMLKNAKSLLAKGGSIWYMTCSILRHENEEMVAKALEMGLKVKGQITILPTHNRDGGFGACFEK